MYQVDITSLNLFSTVAASLFTNLGVHVKTSLPVKILDTAASGQFHAHQIRVGQPVEGKVGSALAVSSCMDGKEDASHMTCTAQRPRLRQAKLPSPAVHGTKSS